MRARRGIVLAWGVGGVLAVLAALKFFVADVYPVRSGSMRPTLLGGPDEDGGAAFDESVLVRYARSPVLERFDLVVLDPREEGSSIVKRVVGLPGESIEIFGGDLLVGGRRLDPDAERPAPIPVFDDQLLDVRQYFNFDPEIWTGAEGAWRVDADGVARGMDRGMMLFQKDLQDGYLDQRGQRVGGLRQVNDGILECELWLEEPVAPDGRLRFQLVEDGDTFQVLLAPRAGGGFGAELLRRNDKTLKREDPVQRTETLATGEARLVPESWQRLRFANVDNALSFSVDGAIVLRHVYEANELHPARTPPGTRSVGPRVGFGAELCRARFRGIRILRDLYYTEAGRFAQGAPLALGPDEYFVLGDNSAYSSDSRHFGAVRAAEIVGRPVAVVWPLGRVRLLRR